jgi:hypothetical protein
MHSWSAKIKIILEHTHLTPPSVGKRKNIISLLYRKIGQILSILIYVTNLVESKASLSVSFERVVVSCRLPDGEPY